MVNGSVEQVVEVDRRIIGVRRLIGVASAELGVRLTLARDRASDAPFALTRTPKPVSLAEATRRHILDTLAFAGGNRTLAARHLGINRKTMYLRLSRYQKGPPP